MILGSTPNTIFLKMLLEVELLSRIGAALGSIPENTPIIITASQCLATNMLDVLMGKHVD